MEKTPAYLRHLAISNNWKKNNRPKMNAAKKRWRRQTKRKAYAILGNRCANCKTKRNLQIDHKHGDGRLDRANGKGSNSLVIYRKIVNGIERDRFQILCHPCNWAKEKERRSKT